MKFHILSDLHNEFLRHSGPLPSHPWSGSLADTDADVIVLAGDVDVGLHGVEWMIDEAERLARPIVYVLGNHEFYLQEYFSLKRAIIERCENTRVHVLDCGCVEFPDATAAGRRVSGVRILGATLWTDYLGDPGLRMPQDLAMYYASSKLADHRAIRYRDGEQDLPFHPLHALSLHQREKHWLLSSLATPFSGKTLVVSHHAPHPCCSHPGFPNNPLGPAFFSDLESVLRAFQIDLWVYGHTHANFDGEVCGTRVVCNQAGYPGERVDGFDAGFVVEL